MAITRLKPAATTNPLAGMVDNRSHTSQQSIQCKSFFLQFFSFFLQKGTLAGKQKKSRLSNLANWQFGLGDAKTLLTTLSAISNKARLNTVLGGSLRAAAAAIEGKRRLMGVTEGREKERWGDSCWGFTTVPCFTRQLTALLHRSAALTGLH